MFNPFRDTAWVMSWFEAQKGHTKWNRIRETQKRLYALCSDIKWVRVVSNQYSKKFFESWVNLNQNSGKPFESWVNLNQNSGKLYESWVDWIEILESHLSPVSIWIKLKKTFQVWVDLNQFLKAIVSHELSQNQNFLRLSWIESKKNESCPCLTRTPITFFFESRPGPKLGGYVIYFCCNLLRLCAPFSSHSFLSFSTPKFRESAQDLSRIPEPWFQNSNRFLPIFMVFRSHLQRKNCDIKHYGINNQVQYSGAPYSIMFC